MALFVDGDITSTEDLLGYESSVLNVAKSEGIDLSAKLALAQEEIEIELTGFLVQNADDSPIADGKITIANVAVTEPLRKWHAFQTLSLLYREAYNSQLNDRFAGKWKEYERLANWASRWLLQIGVGIVRTPIPRPLKPETGSIPAPLPGGAYYIRTTWLKGEAESTPSPLMTATVADGNALVVTAREWPSRVTGWNLYAGTSASNLALQSDSPLQLGATWAQKGTGLLAGRAPGNGQTADYLLRATRRIWRG